MKAIPFALLLLLVSCSSLAFAKSAARASFDLMKSLAGTWEGAVTTFPANANYRGSSIPVRLRVTPSGNALMHELNVPGAPDDPITTMHLNGNRLFVLHDRDAGKRARMVADSAPHGKTIEFNLADTSGSRRYGYMQNAVFTTIDACHHTEDWTYVEPGHHPVRAHFDLHRVHDAVAPVR